MLLRPSKISAEKGQGTDSAATERQPWHALPAEDGGVGVQRQVLAHVTRLLHRTLLPRPAHLRAAARQLGVMMVEPVKRASLRTFREATHQKIIEHSRRAAASKQTNTQKA